MSAGAIVCAGLPALRKRCRVSFPHIPRCAGDPQAALAHPVWLREPQRAFGTAGTEHLRLPRDSAHAAPRGATRPGGRWVPVLPPVRACPGSAGTDTCRPVCPPPSLRGLGPARGSGCTGASPGTLGSAPNARPHWLPPPVGAASPAPARTGSALGAQRDEKALRVIFSLIGRAGPSGRGLRGAVPCDWLTWVEGAVPNRVSPPRSPVAVIARARRGGGACGDGGGRGGNARGPGAARLVLDGRRRRGDKYGSGQGGPGWLRSGGFHSGCPGWRGFLGGPLGGSVRGWTEGCPAGAPRGLGGIPAPRVGSGPAPGAAGVGGGAAARAPAAGHVRGGRGRDRGNGGALRLSEHGRAGLSSTLPSGSPGARAEDAPAHRVLADLF